MLTDLRDAYPPICEDVSIIIKRPAAELERSREPRVGALLMAGMVIAIFVAAIAGYHYAVYTLFTGKILGAMH